MVSLLLFCLIWSAEPPSWFIQRRDSNRATRSAVNSNCKIPHGRSKFGQSAFCLNGCQLWNWNQTHFIYKIFYNKRLTVGLKQKQNRTHFYFIVVWCRVCIDVLCCVCFWLYRGFMMLNIESCTFEICCTSKEQCKSWKFASAIDSLCSTSGAFSVLELC